jgi:hypothetical protein
MSYNSTYNTNLTDMAIRAKSNDAIRKLTNITKTYYEKIS